MNNIEELKLAYTAIERSYVKIDKNIHNDITKQHEFRKKKILMINYLMMIKNP